MEDLTELESVVYNVYPSVFVITLREVIDVSVHAQLLPCSIVEVLLG
jgi:hypothetical protein